MGKGVGRCPSFSLVAGDSLSVISLFWPHASLKSQTTVLAQLGGSPLPAVRCPILPAPSTCSLSKLGVEQVLERVEARGTE